MNPANFTGVNNAKDVNAERKLSRGLENISVDSLPELPIETLPQEEDNLGYDKSDDNEHGLSSVAQRRVSAFEIVLKDPNRRKSIFVAADIIDSDEEDSDSILEVTSTACPPNDEEEDERVFEIVTSGLQNQRRGSVFQVKQHQHRTSMFELRSKLKTTPEKDSTIPSSFCDNK